LASVFFSGPGRRAPPASPLLHQRARRVSQLASLASCDDSAVELIITGLGWRRRGRLASTGQVTRPSFLCRASLRLRQLLLSPSSRVPNSVPCPFSASASNTSARNSLRSARSL